MEEEGTGAGAISATPWALPVQPHIKAIKTYGQEIEMKQEAEARERAERSAKIEHSWRHASETRSRRYAPLRTATVASRPVGPRENIGACVEGRLHTSSPYYRHEARGTAAVFTRDVRLLSAPLSPAPLPPRVVRGGD